MAELYSACMDQLSDEQLVALWADEEQDGPRRQLALDTVFSRYQTKVALWCFRFSGDRDQASDLAQEVFLRLMAGLSNFRGESKFSTWLYIVTRNHCFNAGKLRNNRQDQPLEFQDFPDTQSRGADQQVELASEIRQMQELLANTLDPTERQVMTLHYGEELTLQSITGLLGLQNASGAKAFIVSARRKLSTALVRLKSKQEGDRKLAR